MLVLDRCSRLNARTGSMLEKSLLDPSPVLRSIALVSYHGITNIFLTEFLDLASASRKDAVGEEGSGWTIKSTTSAVPGPEPQVGQEGVRQLL